MRKKYRLIWFQHLHKAAGSTIVATAIRNNEKLFPNHKNGNPVDKNGNYLDFNDISQEELESFIDNCQKKGVTFIATEWSSPDFEVLSKDPRVSLITCIRKPLERLVSNFRYDLYRLYTGVDKIEKYIDSGDVHTRNNYYCRVFAHEHSFDKIIRKHSFKIAQRNLSLFDFIVIQENRNDFNKLNQYLNWSNKTLHAGRSYSSMHPYIKLLFHGQLNLFLNYLFKKKIVVSDVFKQRFNKNNHYDQKLYNYAKNLH